MHHSLDPLRRPSALAALALWSALAAAGPVEAAQRRGPAGGAQEPAAPASDVAPAATASAAPFTVRCRWRSEKSGDGHAREVARVLAAVAAVAVEAGLVLGPDTQLTLDVHDGLRELERATAARTAPDVVRVAGAVREPGLGAVHVALRPRVADRVHFRYGTSPFLLRRAAHEGARLYVEAWIRGQSLRVEAADGWVTESVALALAEEGLRRAARSIAPPDEVATSHGLVLLQRALAGGTQPLALLAVSGAGDGDRGHGEAYTAAQAARLAVGAALLAPDSAEGGAAGLLAAAARPGELLGEGALDAARVEALRALVLAAGAGKAAWEEVTPGTATWPALLGPVDPATGGAAAVLDPGGLVQWALPRVDTLALATEAFAGDKYVVVGTFEPLPLDGNSAAQADIAFADHGGGDRCLCVFNSREGTWVLRRDPKTGEYGQITGDLGLRPVVGAVNSFELRVDGDTIVVALNGQVMGAGRATGLDLSGRYGVGAHGGSGVIWRGVRSVPPE